MTSTTSPEELLRAENAELRARLEEADETLRVIRIGGVDALVVESADGPQIFRRQGLDAESNRFRGEILAQVSDAVIAVDADQRVTYLNAVAERQYRVSSGDALGRQLSEIYTRRWPHAEAERLMWAALREHAEWRGEVIHHTHDGREIAVETSVTTLRDASGEPVGYVRVFHDITERKQAEVVLESSLKEMSDLRAAINEQLIVSSVRQQELTEAAENLNTQLRAEITEHKQTEAALRLSEERLARVLEHLPVGVSLFDREGQMVLTNASMRRFIGECVPSLDRQRRHRWRACAPDGSPLEFDQWPGQRALRGETVLPGIEFIFTEDDGRETWVNVAATPLRETGGLVVMMEDIGERKRSERNLRESDERMRMATEATAVGIWERNVQTDTLRWDAQMFRIYGIAPTADGIVQYSDWTGTVLPEELPENERILQETIRTCGQSRREFRIRRREDGEVRDIEAVETVRCNGRGQVEWVLGTNLDITARQAAEESLRLTAEELARTARAKDDFLAALSHELRTPLTPVLMTASALAGDPALPLEVREQLSMIHRNIELEARLIDDLLDHTTISRGKLILAPVVTDLHALLGHTDEIIRSDCLGKQVRIEFRLGARRHHARVDPTRLQQVFWNLIKNAVKFTPKGGSIIVSTTNDADDRIVISVKDSGIGMSAETQPHIFNAFEQGAIAGQHRYGGLGLGLAISHAIITAHDGAIRSESEGLNCGSTFTVLLQTIDAPAGSTSTAEPGAVPTRTRKLLIVEDHEATRKVMQRLLTLKGHQVTTAGSVQEALAIHGTERFDAVISDLGLPDGSGLDLMRELQRQRPVPGIALSGYGMEGDVRRTKEAGFFAHLVKPVNFDQLRQLIDRIPSSLP